MKRKIKIIIMIFITVLVLLVPFFYTYPKANSDFSGVISSVLKNGATPEQVNQILEYVLLLENNQKSDAKKILEKLSQEIGEQNILNMTLPKSTVGSDVYRGFFLNDVADMRVVLSNIDKAKQDGFDIVLLQIEMEPKNKNTLKEGFYVPGKEVYLFYLNAFRKAGFRIILSVGHTSYEIHHQIDIETERGEYGPAFAKEYLYPQFEAIIFEWAEIANEHDVEAFIPLEEASALLVDPANQHHDLYPEDRKFMSVWAQEIREKVQKKYSGKLGFATNDGGVNYANRDMQEFNCTGPDFDYRNYEYIFAKVPFRGSFEDDEQWLNELTNRFESTKQYMERDGVLGVIWYEAGLPIGKSMESNQQNHKTFGEEKRIYAIKKTFEYANKYNLKGIFFKPSPTQIHEAEWNFFGTPSEKVIRENYAKIGVIEPEPLDDLWITLGDDGLRVIQILLSDEMPFDPQYIINQNKPFSLFRE